MFVKENILPIIAALALLLTSCSTEDFLGGNNNVATVPLTIADVSTNNNVSYVVTRAAIDGTSLPSGSSIGLYLSESGEATYDYEAVSNKEYTYGTSWAAESGDEIMLSATEGNLYAYYPYQSTADASAVTLKASIDGDDFCWGASPAAVSASSPTATLTLNHKLTRIDVTVKRDTYTGTGSLTSITLSGSNITTGGSMSPTTGTVTPNSAAAFTQTVTGYTVVTDNTNEIKCLLVPVNETASDVTLKCTIDGTEYTTTIPSLSLGAGKKYDVTVMLNNGGLTITGTEVGSWDPINKTITVGDHTITLVNSGSIANNVIVSSSAGKGAYGATANGNSTLTIVSMPIKAGYWVSRPTAITDKGATTQNNFSSATSTLSNGVRTTTITGITGDVTVTFDSNNDGLSLAVPYVDLGLTSGTRWAQCNLNDKDKMTDSTYPAENYGGYYSWGETSGNKSYYGWCESETAGVGVTGWVSSGYKYGKPYRNRLGINFYYTNYISKYILAASKKYGYISDTNYGNYYDGLSELEATDDAATMNWGSDWQTPSNDQYNELTSSTTTEWTTVNSKNGYKFTNKSDATAYIFLAAAGYKSLQVNPQTESWGCYWSRTLHADDSQEANRLLFSSSGINSSDVAADSDRPFGDSVRPVLHADALTKTYK